MTRPPKTYRPVIGLVGWLLLAYLTAALGGLGSASAGSFFEELVRPDWAPPAWLFGPVWTVLYTLMGVASWLVWMRCGFSAARTALAVYLAQLAANALWSWVFFAWRLGAWAVVEIGVLLALIVATLVLFARCRRLAAFLLVPYLLWVCFAAALTVSLWRLNPGLLG